MKKKLMTVIAVCAFVLTACGTAQTNEAPTPTDEPAKALETTTAPTEVPTQAVVPTLEPTATSTPTPEPTATNTPTPEQAATSTPTPEPTATSTPTPEPTATSTPTPVPTSTPTPAPTATQVPLEVSDVELTDFGTILKELHSLETYEEREGYVEKLDKSKYKVETMDNFNVITYANGVSISKIQTYDLETNEYITTSAPNSEVHYPSFGQNVLKRCAGIGDDYYYDDMDGGELPTGEVYLMTITNLATGESDPWGVKIHKAGAKYIETENEWGWTSYTYVIDSDSPVTVAYCTVEELVNEKNASANGDYSYYEGHMTIVQPVRPEEKYDDNWNPTGEYFLYETSEETIYVAPEKVEYNEWWESYCFTNENGWLQELMQDESGAYYYILENQYEVPVSDYGYTVVVDEEYGPYLVDKDGTVVTYSYDMTEERVDPSITTWDTLKYYQDVYDPRFWRDFVDVYNYEGAYAIADMKAEEYPYLSQEEFESLIKRYMDVFDITLDEEVLAIRASIPEDWGWQYKHYYDKACVLGIGGEWTDSGEITWEAVITIERPEHWYFSGSNLAVKDESIRTKEPAHTVEYIVTYVEPGKTEEETKEAALDYLTLYNRYLTKEETEHVKSLTVNEKPVFYAETTDSWDEGWKRSFVVLQDIGFSRLISMQIETYDLNTEAAKLVEMFLLDDNYSIEQ